MAREASGRDNGALAGGGLRAAVPAMAASECRTTRHASIALPDNE